MSREIMFKRKIFSERVNQLRKENNLSQQQLAEIANVSYHMIGKIENQKTSASIEVIYQLADYFDVSIDYLTGRSNR